jgi:hypothetical protein
MRRDVNPDPVPPPKEWKIRNPWSPGGNVAKPFFASSLTLQRNKLEYLVREY